MTFKRDKKKDEPKDAERPKLKKETLRDLDATHHAALVRGGFRRDDGNCTDQASGCGSE